MLMKFRMELFIQNQARSKNFYVTFVLVEYDEIYRYPAQGIFRYSIKCLRHFEV